VSGSVTYDFSSAYKMLDAVTKQARFACASALTRTAQDVQEAVRTEMPRNFTIRRPWVVQGIRIKPANKQNLTAEVYSRDPFMGLQERGGVKRAIGKRVFEWGDYLAVPVDARRGKTDIVRPQDRPKALIDPFVLTARDGRKYLAVKSLTVGKNVRSIKTMRGKQKRETGVRLMYVLVKQETLRPRLGLTATAARIVPARWPINLANALEQAVATAR